MRKEIIICDGCNVDIPMKNIFYDDHVKAEIYTGIRFRDFDLCQDCYNAVVNLGLDKFDNLLNDVIDYMNQCNPPHETVRMILYRDGSGRIESVNIWQAYEEFVYFRFNSLDDLAKHV